MIRTTKLEFQMYTLCKDFKIALVISASTTNLVEKKYFSNVASKDKCNLYEFRNVKSFENIDVIQKWIFLLNRKCFLIIALLKEENLDGLVLICIYSAKENKNKISIVKNKLTM